MAAKDPVPKTVREEAARWLMEQEAGPLSETDAADMNSWLEADPRHRGAYVQLEESWAFMGSLPVLNRLARHRRRSWLSFMSASPRHWLAGSIAAGLIVVVSAVGDVPMRLRADAITGTGEHRDMTLADGSMIALNTGSAVSIDYRSDRRVVHLLRGEAAFIVARDPVRPFTVEAADGATTALGTRLAVRRREADTDVTVTEHSVRIQAASSQLRLGEHGAARYGPDGLIRLNGVDADAATAWTRGYVVFVDQPLNEVITELGRYYPGYVRLLGDDLAKRRFSGVFRTADPSGGLETIQRSLGLRSTRLTDRLVFLYR